MTIYFISGLGADESIFQFLDLPGLKKVFIKWIPPKINEELSSYAERLTAQIDLTQEVILAGISFGGIVAQEIAKIITFKKLIIISSVKSNREFNWQLSFVAFTRIHKLFPVRFLKWSNLITADYYFGTTSAKESKLLHQIIQDTDDVFMVWAINCIMTWKNVNIAEDIIHIHGTSDKIFSIRPIKSCIKITDGGHFMIVNKSEEISTIIMSSI